MAVILCIETSGEKCSVALFNNEQLIDERTDDRTFQHAAVVTVLIEEILIENQVSRQQLDAIAVSAGPGSYTGLRIGTSVAKGLCYALDIPLIAINSLMVVGQFALQHALDQSCDLIAPMIDARRMEVYTTLLDNNLNEIMKSGPMILDEQSFSETLLSKRICFCGSGCTKFSKIAQHQNAVFLNETGLSASQMGELATNKYKEADFVDVAYFEPYYLKEFYTSAPKTKRS